MIECLLQTKLGQKVECLLQTSRGGTGMSFADQTRGVSAINQQVNPKAVCRNKGKWFARVNIKGKNKVVVAKNILSICRVICQCRYRAVHTTS